MKHLALFLALLLPLGAEDFYFAQTTQGTGDGLSAANAWGVATAGSPANWGRGTGRISPGDTLHVVGTITSPLVVQGSGTAGKVITILFEPDAKFSSPAWSGGTIPGTGAIVVDTKDYITIDGGANGIIENTDNGTNLGHHENSTGVNGTSCSNFTVQNLTIQNLYVRVAGPEQFGYGVAILDTAKNNAPFSNFRATNNRIHDAYIGVSTDYPIAGAANIEIDHNTMYNVNWGGRCGDRNDGSRVSHVSFHHNRVYNFTNWDDTLKNSFHHNGFYGWAEQIGGHSILGSASAYCNVIGPNFSHDSVNHATSGIYFSSRGAMGPLLICNNIFIENQLDYPSNGDIYILPAGGSVTRIYHNTFIGGGKGIAIGYDAGREGVQHLYIANNLITRKCAVYVANHGSLVADIDHNLSYDAPPELGYSWSPTSSGKFKSFAEWQGLGFDAHGLTADPKLNGRYQPTKGSPAIAAGNPAVVATFVPLDAAGKPRVTADLGAYRYDEHDEAGAGH